MEKTIAAYEQKGYAGNALREAIKSEIVKFRATAPSDPDELKQLVLANARFWDYQPEKPKTEQTAPEEIAKIAAAQAASKTLPGGGTANSGEITLEDVEAMSGAELDALALKDPEFFARLNI